MRWSLGLALLVALGATHSMAQEDESDVSESGAAEAESASPEGAGSTEPTEAGVEQEVSNESVVVGLPRQPAPRARRLRLDNGLQVQLLRHGSGSFAGVCVVYGAGTVYDPSELRGLAHLTERSMLGPLPSEPNGASAVLDRIGSGRALESTTFDHATFCEEVPAENLASAVYMEAERMGYLLSSLTQEQVVRYRAALLRESEEVGEYFAGWHERDAESAALWRGHPYRHGLQDLDAIGAARLSNVQWFHQRHYGPANASLAIVTPRELDEVERVVREYFDHLRGQPRPPAPRAILAPLPRSERITVATRLYREQIRLTWITPPYFEPGDAALDIAAHALGERLEERLDKSIVSWTWSGVVSRELGSFFQVIVETERGHRALSLLSLVEEELSHLREEGISQEELAVGRERFIAHDQTPLDLAFFLASHSLHGRELEVSYDAQRYRDVSRSDVSSAVDRWLRPEARLLLYRRFDGRASEAGDVLELPSR